MCAHSGGTAVRAHSTLHSYETKAAMSSRGPEFGCIMDALEAALLPKP